MQAQPTPPASSPDRSGFAIASLVLGIISLCAWLLPICGIPFSGLGIIFGALSMRSSRRGMAIAGLILGIIALLLSLGNAAFGAYLGITGNMIDLGSFQ
jgi:hypothetical protein